MLHRQTDSCFSPIACMTFSESTNVQHPTKLQGKTVSWKTMFLPEDAFSATDNVRHDCDSLLTKAVLMKSDPFTGTTIGN